MFWLFGNALGMASREARHTQRIIKQKRKKRNKSQTKEQQEQY